MYTHASNLMPAPCRQAPAVRSFCSVHPELCGAVLPLAPQPSTTEKSARVVRLALLPSRPSGRLREAAHEAYRMLPGRNASRPYLELRASDFGFAQPKKSDFFTRLVGFFVSLTLPKMPLQPAATPLFAHSPQKHPTKKFLKNGRILWDIRNHQNAI